MISVLIPERGRPAMLRSLLGSLVLGARDDDDFEILVAIDEDDPDWEGRALIAYRNTRYYRWPRPATLGAKLNMLADQATGDVLFFIANDMLMETFDWPRKVREGVARLPATRIGVPFANSTLSPGEPTYPILTRETVKAVGGYMNPDYPYWFIDTEWGEFGRMIGQLFVIDVTLSPQPGSGKTHGMIDLPFWVRYFEAGRLFRQKTAEAILGAPPPMELVNECVRRTAHLSTPEFLARWGGNADSPPGPQYAEVKKAAEKTLKWVEEKLKPGPIKFLPMPPPESQEANRTRYLDLLESVLTGTLTRDPSGDLWSPHTFDPARRAVGADWPATALTMIGTQRMRQLRWACDEVLRAGIPGDFIETGVWRGGACIYMRAILASWGDTTRKVFLADSFEGLPPPDPAYPADAADKHHTFTDLAVSVEQVWQNFADHGLLDGQVHFLKGWFKDTLQTDIIGQLAILRLDGDMFQSTWEALTALYPKLSPGGICIIDDYFMAGCSRAVHLYRAREGITAEIMPIDGYGVWWRK